MSARLSPQREFEIGARAGHLYEYSTSHDVEWDALAGEDVPALVAELAATREELAVQKDHVDHLERNTLPELRREVEHHKAGKERWRKRAEQAEARVAELEAASEPQHFGICFTNVRGHRLVNGHCLYCGMSAEEATS